MAGSKSLLRQAPQLDVVEQGLTEELEPMGQINFELWFDNLRLGPGASGTYVEDNVSQTEAKLRWFTAVPLHSLGDDFIANAQMIQITNVFHLLKVKNRARAGIGGVDILQIYVTVRNLDPVNTVTFQLYKAEISRWQMITQIGLSAG